MESRRVDTVTIHRVVIAEILAEGDRRADAGEPNGAPVRFEGESAAAFRLRQADAFIHIACEHAAFGPWFAAISRLHAEQRSAAIAAPVAGQ
jgi:hypothetical protein